MPRILINVCLVGFLLFVAVGVLYPNPYGNNPDIIGDESYFLTSSLSALDKGILPGWEFSQSGSYYAGPQVYLDTAVLIPIVGITFFVEHFSLTATKAFVALHTGDLLHVLRIVNGLSALIVFGFFIWYFRKREIPKRLALTLAVFAGLLLSNVMFIEFLHTAKVWTFYNLIVATASVFFIAQDYYLRHLGKPFIERERYIALIAWCGALALFQNYFGVFSILFLAGYAVYLRHIEWRELVRYVLRNWYWFLLVALLQISFLWRAVFINGVNSFMDMSARHGSSIDWMARFYNPVRDALTAEPFIVLYVVFTVVVAILAVRKSGFLSELGRRRIIAIACIHPVVVYLVFHVISGLSVMPRYGILLSMAGAFSITLLLGEFDARFAWVTLAASAVLFAVINVHSIGLYWHPSSEKVLLETLIEKYDSPDQAFVTTSSALRLTLPVNEASLALMNPNRASFSRFAFLAQHPDLLRTLVPFKPLTMITYSPEEEAAAIATLKHKYESVWLITTDCSILCTTAESAAGKCFAFNLNACDIAPQEVNGLPVFLQSTELGHAYIVRNVP